MYLPVTVDPRKVAAYIRWSTDEQAEGTTLEVQRQACSQFILSQGWEFQESLVFIDEGYSGGTLDRPGLTALRKAVQNGDVTCVVVFKLDRLSRSVLDTVQLVLQEWEGCCYLKSAREPVDTTSPTGKVFFYMLASYAEWERSVIRERTMSGKIRRAQEGRNPGGGIPYGYVRGASPGELLVDEAKAPIVRRIYREYLNGLGSYQIASRLNQEGICASKGGKWNKTSVDHILQSKAYTGVFEYGKTTDVPKELRKKVGKASVTFAVPRYATIEDAFPPVITKDEFDKAQRIRMSRSAVKGKRALNADYLLSGVVKCRCGSALIGQSYERGKYRYYRCSALMHSPSSGCDAGHLPAELIEMKVLTAVKERLSPDNMAAVMQRQQQKWQARVHDLELALRETQSALAGLSEKRRRLDRDYDAGELPARIYTARVDGLEVEEKEIRARASQLVADLSEMRDARSDADEYLAEAAKIDAWDHLTNEQRKQLLRVLVEELIVYRRRAGRHKKRNDNPIEIDLVLRMSGRPLEAQGSGLVRQPVSAR